MSDLQTMGKPRDPVATLDERLAPLLAGLRQQGWLLLDPRPAHHAGTLAAWLTPFLNLCRRLRDRLH